MGTASNVAHREPWNKGKIVTTLKGVNLLDKQIQQHVYGDILRRAITLEARLTF